MKEGEPLEIQVANHWIEVELEPETYRRYAGQCPENRRLK